MERKAQKLHRKKKKIDESIKVEEKRYRAMRPVGNEKKNLPGRCAANKFFFWPKDQGPIFSIFRRVLAKFRHKEKQNKIEKCILTPEIC